jgi:mono/diheme cytochrome c family protein
MKWLILVELLIGQGVPASAQDNDAGKSTYLSSCAPCHGTEAKGDGFLNSVLKVPAPDLTTLAKRNNGDFPTAAVTEIIDGRKVTAAHGTREMPIWGFAPWVRDRISIIVDYLNRIQVR